MRALVTGGFHYSAYATLRALRPDAQHLGVSLPDAAEPGIGRSRLVDEVVEAPIGTRMPPHPLRLGEDNTLAEERYVGCLLEACTRSRYDLLVPTSDNDVYVASKNRARFERIGVTVVAPALDAVLAVTDKYRCPLVAREVGLPAPATTLCEDGEDVAAAAAAIGYPVVVKPRFSYGGLGVALARDAREALAAADRLRGWSGGTVMQEYVPGNEEPSLAVVVDGAGTAAVMLALRKHRYASASMSTSITTTAVPGVARAVVEFVRHVGLVGVVGVQLKRDSRDGTHRLIEMNPRWGANFRILVRMGERQGVDLVATWLAAARGERADRCVLLPPGLAGVSPFEDLFAVRAYWAARRGAAAHDNPAPPLGAFVRSYARTYLRERPTVDVFARALLDDPRATLGGLRHSRRLARFGNSVFVPWGNT